MIKFTEIANRLKYPSNVKSRLSAIHTDIINYVLQNFSGKLSERRHIIDIMNTVSYKILSGDTIPNIWNSKDPLKGMSIVEDLYSKDKLGDIYLSERDIDWDIEISDKVDDVSITSKPLSVVTKSENTKHKTPVNKPIVSDKSDLYLSPPSTPRFDITMVWKSGTVGNTEYNIYYSLPLIPTKQNEISVTTDIKRMVESDFLRLFPNTFIPTRSEIMYKRIPNLDYDSKLGIILPISGFSYDEIRDNIIKYPHLFRLYRVVDGKKINFFSHIEIGGELYSITDMWNKLDDTSNIPYHPDFIKEYVIRRYLLERDVKGVKHKYPIFGGLKPYLTLFMPSKDYSVYGYTDALELSMSCVKARVDYKRSRNPIIVKLKEADNA